MIAVVVSLTVGGVVLTLGNQVASIGHMLEHGPREEVLERWIAEGDSLYRAVERFRAEHDRLPVDVGELASSHRWDEPVSHGLWRTEEWRVADFGARGFAVFLPVDLSSSVKDVLVRRSTGRYPGDLAERAGEVIERGSWRYLRGARLSPEPRAFEQLVLRPVFHSPRPTVGSAIRRE
ncbi:hypothetical protein Pla163_28960 [Planctomycetes bacterium Pla163]|uniref:Uncharacterized protein n=1 Tax=Rohdeia mirabilis TaxID=2528008 RepID=A0A518D2S7_9BACT|nr:hypothetical protein Pla163_28960 [Planctomycetes bacterium Pla163]